MLAFELRATSYEPRANKSRVCQHLAVRSSRLTKLCLPQLCHPERSEAPAERSRRTPGKLVALPALGRFYHGSPSLDRLSWECHLPTPLLRQIHPPRIVRLSQGDLLRTPPPLQLLLPSNRSDSQRYKSSTRAPWWKNSQSSSHCKQVSGPSTPLGCRLAALRMAELQEPHCDHGHKPLCVAPKAIARPRSHSQRDQQNTPHAPRQLRRRKKPHTRVLSQMWGCTDYSPQADGSSAQDATWFSRC